MISPISTDSSYSSTTMDEKNNNLTTKKTSSTEKQSRTSIDLNRSIRREYPIGKNFSSISNKKNEFVLVTVYLNYLGDNSGMLLNPQKFRLMMPSMFGPGESHTVLAAIFDSCIKCAFSQAFPQQILNAFPRPEISKQDSYTPIKCMSYFSFFPLIKSRKKF